MKGKVWIKTVVDIGMTVILLLLMTYERIGQAVHEWLGIGMFVLFWIHHVLNYKWSRNLGRGNYTPFRIWQTVLVVLVLLSMIGSMISGVILSRYAVSFLPIKRGRSFGRNLHMLSAYWGVVCMSLHLGLHWNRVVAMIGKQKKSAIWLWGMRIAAFIVALYGGYAFRYRDIGSYMFLKIQFVFFDFEEPLLFLWMDYLAIMGLFVWISYYFTRILIKCSQKRKI